MSDPTKWLENIGVVCDGDGVRVVSDHVACTGYIHHSAWPLAVVAYTLAGCAVIAENRFPGRTMVELVHKVPSMDGPQYAALSMVCGAPGPLTWHQSRAAMFGRTVWEIVDKYKLGECFLRVERPFGSSGEHYCLRPRGYDWSTGGEDPIPAELKAMRKAYRGMDPLQRVMALTVLHLYLTRKDEWFLKGCPTKILAVDAVATLRDNGAALADWGRLVSHYSGW